MTKGVIYVLTNPSFPEYVKIGYADNLEKRLKELNQSECLPFAFRVHCIYEVEKRLTDLELHKLIDQLNPSLRSIDEFDGKVRKREFYNISAEDAYEILKSIALISGTPNRLKKMKPEGHEVLDEELATAIQNSGVILYDEASHLQHGSQNIQILYNELKQKILKLDKNIYIEPKKLYIAFKMDTNICDVEIQRSKLKVTINLPKGKLQDPDKIAEDVSLTGHWGNGDYRIILSDNEMLDYAINLIKQAYLDKIK